MNRRFGMTLAAAASAVVACGGASGSTAPPESAEVTIAIENFSFGEPVNLATGDSVTQS